MISAMIIACMPEKSNSMLLTDPHQEEGTVEQIMMGFDPLSKRFPPLPGRNRFTTRSG